MSDAHDDLMVKFKDDPELLLIVTEFDYQKYQEWLKTHLDTGQTWPREILEVSMHKCRTYMPSCPMELRIESKKWLIDHEWTSEDSGDIP